LGHLFLLCTIQFAHTQMGEQLQETHRIWQGDAMKCLGVYCVQHLSIDLFYFHFWNFFKYMFFSLTSWQMYAMLLFYPQNWGRVFATFICQLLLEPSVEMGLWKVWLAARSVDDGN
jgi:hypothetical protein